MFHRVGKYALVVILFFWKGVLVYGQPKMNGFNSQKNLLSQFVHRSVRTRVAVCAFKMGFLFVLDMGVLKY